MADTSNPHSLNDYCLQEHRLVVVKPGDILVIQHSDALTQEAVRTLRQATGVSLVIGVPGDVDINAVRYPTADGR
ncbi:hypothetical protein [Streptomyces anulatus]|uniref:hypothetical protein n=1 Tax=Streptomyces anulatus TaxID=1892 RepID=UPI00367A5499